MRFFEFVSLWMQEEGFFYIIILYFFLPKNRITLSSFNQIKIILVLQIKGVGFILDRFFF
jgi:hypothetical protein